jgi:hypothetical protein
MLDFLRLFLHVLAAPFPTQAQLEAEVTLLFGVSAREIDLES